MSVIHTKRVFPYAVGPGDINWDNPENAMQEGEPYATVTREAAGMPGHVRQRFTFDLGIPTYVTLHGIRWVVRGRFEAEVAERTQVALDSLGYVDQNGELRYLSTVTWAQVTRFWTLSTVTIGRDNFAGLRWLNDNREAWSALVVEALATTTGETTTEPSTTVIDYVALEIDYTFPEFPLQVDLRIE